MTDRAAAAAKAASPTVAFWAGLLLLLIAFVLVWLFLPLKEWLETFTAWTRELGWLGVIGFAGVYVIAVVLLVPSWPASVAAGFAFGAWAFPLVVLSATIGASLAFLVSRFLLRERVKLLARRSAVIDAIDSAIAEEDWKVVVLLRLSPLVPFNLQNYFLGATDIGFVSYVLATFFGMMPGAAAYVYLGILGRAVANANEGSSLKLALLILGLVASAVLVVMVGRKAKSKLQTLGVDRQ